MLTFSCSNCGNSQKVNWNVWDLLKLKILNLTVGCHKCQTIYKIRSNCIYKIIDEGLFCF